MSETPNIEVNPIGNLEFYSIAIGVVGSGLQYHVGQKIKVTNKECTITHIIRDDSFYYSTEKVVYMIFADIEGEIKPIKIFIDQPVYISVKVWK